MALGALSTAVGFLKEGANSNWWGLGCPSHCSSPTFGFSVAVFFVGLLTGLLISLALVAYWLLLERRRSVAVGVTDSQSSSAAAVVVRPCPRSATLR